MINLFAPYRIGTRNYLTHPLPSTGRAELLPLVYLSIQGHEPKWNFRDQPGSFRGKSFRGNLAFFGRIVSSGVSTGVDVHSGNSQGTVREYSGNS
jgi:hypothetical protein